MGLVVSVLGSSNPVIVGIFRLLLVGRPLC